MTPIYHFALEANWREACERGGPYEISSIDATLAEEGFIHCSTAAQLRRTADRFYAGRRDVLLLTIDPERVAAPLVYEPADRPDGGFPHLYGPLPIDAVVEVRHLLLDAEGRLELERD
jgi:glutathione S-transferase